MKQKIKFLFIFYKSLLTVSISISLLLGILGFAYFFQIFAISFITAGPAMGLLYKELTETNQYYFYYNKGISKAWLLVSTMVINVFIGVLILSIAPHA